MTKFIFGLPIFFYVIQLILQLTYFRRDSPKFLLLSGKKSEAKKEIAKIYSKTEGEGVTDLIAVGLAKSM